MMSNIIQGRDPEEDLVARTVRSLPGLGVASLAADGFMQGDVGGTAPVFAGPNNLFQMVDKLKRGELEVQDILLLFNLSGGIDIMPQPLEINHIL